MLTSCKNCVIILVAFCKKLKNNRMEDDTMRYLINYNLMCEVDRKKQHCLENEPHCHVTRCGIQVAKVLFNPVRIEPGNSLSVSECQLVIKRVSDNAKAILDEYEYNRQNGAD